MKATDAQVSYAQRLIQTGIQSGWMPKKDAPDEKKLKKLNQNEISVLIDGLKKKRGTPTFYGNGKFRGFDKKAAGWRKAPGKQNPRPAKTFDEWYILFDHPRLADYQWTALGGLKPGYKMRKLQTFKTPAEAERVIVTKVLDHILDYKTDFGEFITGWVNPSRTATDNDSAVAQRLLGFILAVMRAAQQSHWTAHWQVQGTSFYGDHQMFERFYGELTEQIDALAEKLVAMHGEQAVNLPEQMRWQAYLAHEWDRHDDDLYYRAYHIEKFLQDHFLKTYEALKHLKQLTLGLDDYLMATANAHETNQYLLGQRIGGRLMTAAAGRLKYQVSLFSDKPGARALWTKTFYSTDDARADQEALRLVKPILKKHDDAEDWVVEPIGHKGKKAATPTGPYNGGRGEKIVDKTNTHVLWQTGGVPGQKTKMWVITDYTGKFVEIAGRPSGYRRKGEAMKEWAAFKDGKKAAGDPWDAAAALAPRMFAVDSQLPVEAQNWNHNLADTFKLSARIKRKSAEKFARWADQAATSENFVVKSAKWLPALAEVDARLASELQKVLAQITGRRMRLAKGNQKIAEIDFYDLASRTAQANQKIIEAPHNFHPVKVEPPKAKRKEYPFEGFIDFQGLKIDVEYKAGSTRSGTGPEGKWSTYMHSHYGEIRGTEGTDGDKLDVYVGENHDSPVVVVIHQHNPWDGKFDEDKVMIGYDSVEEAIGAYKKQYERPGFYVDGKHTAMNIGKFWRWCHDKNNKGKKVSSRVAAAEPLVSQADNRKGWFVIEAGGDIASVTQALNAQMVRRVPPPQQVVKVRGTHKAFSFHWSNAQAQWDVIMVREFPWGIDGAEFFVFTTKAAKSPLGKTWSLAEMRYVAKGLNKHPGYAQSPESARRAEFMPDVNDPNRSWEHIGGDLEASYDGAVYIDIRPKGGGDHMFVSKAALVEAMNLFPATGKAALRTASLWRAAAQVGTDTAAIYALAPEQLQRLIEGGRWLEEWATSPGSPASDKLAAAGVPRDWHEKFDDGKNNGWKGQIGLLISLLGKMDVPKQRQEIRLVPNLRWVSRNLQIENKDHKDFKRAQGLVRDLMKQVGRAERSKKARSLAAKWIGKKAAPKSIPAIPSRIIPQGVSGWQLYDTAGASTAARKMTTRMENNLKSVGRNVRPEYSDAKNAKALAGIVRKMYGVLERRTQWGATDTEPRNEMYSTFEKYLKTYLDQWDFPKTFAVLGG